MSKSNTSKDVCKTTTKKGGKDIHKLAIEQMNTDIDMKIQYYQTLDYIKRKKEYNHIEDFLQNKFTNTPDITINDFESELFEKIKEVYNTIKPYNAMNILYVPPNYVVEDTPADY